MMEILKASTKKWLKPVHTYLYQFWSVMNLSDAAEVEEPSVPEFTDHKPLAFSAFPEGVGKDKKILPD